MLKVMKYDWKYGWNNVRTLLLAGMALAILVGLAHRFFHISEVGVLLFAWMVAFTVLAAISIFRNMTSRMFGPEGYLTHTLPVSTWELLLGKCVGTWLFGIAVAIGMAVCLVLMNICDDGLSGVGNMLTSYFQMLPKLGGFHINQLDTGGLYAVLSVLGFLAMSFLAVVQLQFACIASRQFGKYQIAGGIIVFVLTCLFGIFLSDKLFIGFLLALAISAACFAASLWLQKNRLYV